MMTVSVILQGKKVWPIWQDFGKTLGFMRFDLNKNKFFSKNFHDKRAVATL